MEGLNKEQSHHPRELSVEILSELLKSSFQTLGELKSRKSI
jgi:hypothetical protein